MQLKNVLVLASATAILLGCVGTAPALAKKSDKENDKDFGVNTGALPDSCLKFEGDEIGVEGVAKTVDEVTVTLFDWVEKDGEPGEYIGFSFTAEGGDVTFSVKAGQDIFEDSSSPWINPKGTGGRLVKAISNIVFCTGEEEVPIDMGPAEGSM